MGKLGAVWVLASVLSSCAPQPLAPRDPTPGTPHFRVATFNVHYKKATDAATLQAITSTTADVVALQEVEPALEEALRSRALEQYPHRVYKPDVGPRGLAVLSRFPLVDAGLLPAPHDYHPAHRVIVETPMGPVQMINVHLRSRFAGRADPITDFVRADAEHTLELESFLSACQDLPTIVLGDFNSSPHGQAVKWLERLGFRNALPLFRPGQPTWRGRSVAGQLALTIDHVLFDAAFEPLDAFVADHGASDHLPVVAALESASPTADAALGIQEQERDF
jgi:endonuclease/exonuclease/phosphatase family metal-dependent hydrolase